MARLWMFGSCTPSGMALLLHTAPVKIPTGAAALAENCSNAGSVALPFSSSCSSSPSICQNFFDRQSTSEPILPLPTISLSSSPSTPLTLPRPSLAPTYFPFAAMTIHTDFKLFH
ncbi:hypothetical protein C8R45DRAFT_491465 [Mycena sanguinolenta]|nr:hypothetical protein C8R45DRAFT_491465 [Mycena sanguinolenta]